MIPARSQNLPDHAELAMRTALTDLQLDYAYGIDMRDWERYRAVFADVVEFDFTSWYGGEPVLIKADDWVEQVRHRQSGFDGTQHLMSNHRFARDDGDAIGTTYVVARHYLRIDGEHHVQAIGGCYHNRYIETEAGWKIAACKLGVLWTQGDPDLFRIARERWAAASNTVCQSLDQT